jgi:type VI protein secretion system component Hcp
MKRVGEHRRARTQPRRPGARGERVSASPVATVLALQRSAGNRAVATLLARSPAAAAPQASERTTGSRVVFPDVGTIPIQAAQFGDMFRGGGASRGGRDEERPAVTSITFVSVAGDHSPKLMAAFSAGTVADVEVMVSLGDGSTFLASLKGAVIASYSHAAGDAPTETWSLDFTAIEHRVEGEQQK